MTTRDTVLLILKCLFRAGPVFERPYQLHSLAENVCESSGYEMDLSETSSVPQSSPSTSASVRLGSTTKQ